MLNDAELSAEKIKITSYVCSLLPGNIRDACKNYLNAYNGISEIRLRLNSPVSFTYFDKNIVTGIICTAADISYCTEKMTESNLMLYEEMMKTGYITLKNGCRAGVSGDVFTQNLKVHTLKCIHSVNIRFPSVILTEVKELLQYLEENNHSKSVLVISPPGLGKTTVLRSVAARLSSPPISRRVALIDTRRELYFEGLSTLSDVFLGYPKAEGMRIAATFFNPQYIICDEIGDDDEAAAISSLRHIGVPLIASAHAERYTDLKHRKNLSLMLENDTFDAIMRIYREENEIKSEICTACEVFH